MGSNFSKYALIGSAVLSSYLISSDAYAGPLSQPQIDQQVQKLPAHTGKKPFFSPERVEEIKRIRKITGGKYQQSNVAGVPQTIAIDSTWTYTQINNLMDGDVGTLGKDGVADPAPYSGDTLLFSAGIYQTTPGGNDSYRNSISGIIIQGQTGTIMQNDPQVANGAVFRNFAVDTIINGIDFRGAQLGITNRSANLSPLSPNYITGNDFKTLERASIFVNVTVPGANLTGSVIDDSNTYENIQFGSLHDNQSNPTSAQIAFNQFSNNTGTNVSALWLGPVQYFSATAGGPFYLGTSLADGNVLLNSNGVFMPADAYSGGGLATASSNTAGVNIPDANLEHNVALNPNPSYPYGGSLQSTVGGLNIVADPVLTSHGRPQAFSPLIIENVCKKLDNFERHFCGAKEPAGDYDANGITNNLDAPEMLRVIEQNNNITPWELETFDFNGDNLVTYSDIPGFCATLTYQTGQTCSIAEVIPAVSTWGMVILTLGTFIAGSVVLQRKGHSTSDCSTP